MECQTSGRMQELEELKAEFEGCFTGLQKLVDNSLDLIEQDRALKEDVTGLWKQYISRFSDFTFRTSEKRNNKDVFKAITKALIFGK